MLGTPLPGGIFPPPNFAIKPISPAAVELLKNSDQKIWKAGLEGDEHELDVVFGEVRQEEFFGPGIKPEMIDACSKSIFIPRPVRTTKSDSVNDGDEGAVTLKKGGTGPFQGALMSRKPQLRGIRNARFREYLNKYFPRDNVIMQPMQHIIEGITEGPCQRVDGEEAHQMIDSQKPPSPTHLSIKEKYMQSASLSLLSNGHGEESDRADVGVMTRIPSGGRKLLLKKEYAKKRKKDIGIMQFQQAMGEAETRAEEEEEVDEVNPDRYDCLPPPTPQRRVITVRQRGRRNTVNKNCEYYKQVMENFSKRRKRKREQRRETLIRLANLYSSLSEEVCSVVSENPTPSYALASLRQHQQDPRHRSSSAAVLDRSVLQASPVGRLPRARSENADEAVSKILSQAELEDYFVLLQSGAPNVPRGNTESRSLSCSRQSSCSQLYGVNLQNMGRASSVLAPSPQLLPPPPVGTSVMKAGDGENAGVDSDAGGTFKCPPGMENLCMSLAEDLGHAQACLVCALLPDLVESNKIGYLMPANPFAPVQRLRSIQAVALNQDFVKHFQRPTSKQEAYPRAAGGPLSLFVLPRWEQRYLGLRPDRDREKVVIACRRPPEDVRLWLPSGML
nr:unnamed protein product [Spirometra erinaceieuropaei]